ncbi:DUF721 domain-containing protein [Thermoflavifilum thermophilum]|nr:DUF721 domain-containing protein [Thermoflavifilum thermophilum]
MHQNEVSLAEALKAFLDKSPMKHRLHEMCIQQLWEELMGKTVSKYTERVEWRQGKLIITTHVAPLKQELIYARDRIKQLFNEALQEPLIEEVIIH